MLLRIFRYRWLILEFVLRDLRLRYRGSYFGFLWTLLNPVLYMGIYVLVFGFFLKVGTENYPAFLLSGLIPWTWFQSAITQGSSAILDGRMYIGKTVFPAEVLVVVPIASNLLNFLLSLPLLIIVDICFGVHLGWPLLLLPVAVLLQCLLTYGFLLIISTYNVFFRDLQQLVALLLSFLFFLNPIFYTLDRIPQPFRKYAMLDPITPLLAVYRDVFVTGRFPAGWALLLSAGFAIALCFVGQAVFDRHRDSFAEYM